MIDCMIMTIESIKKEQYRNQIAQMAKDPMVIADIEAIQEDFKYADCEADVFCSSIALSTKGYILQGVNDDTN